MWPFKKDQKAAIPDIRVLGDLLFPEHKGQFEKFCLLYSTNRIGFAEKYEEHLDGFGKDLSELELVYVFGADADLLLLIDWRGEENAEEIEHFIETSLGRTVTWENTKSLRSTAPEEAQRDGKFILALFLTMDKDLAAIGYKLLFFNFPWDAYVFLPIEKSRFNEVIEAAPEIFHGSRGSVR